LDGKVSFRKLNKLCIPKTGLRRWGTTLAIFGNSDGRQALEQITDIQPTPAGLRVGASAKRFMEEIEVCNIHIFSIMFYKEIHPYRYVFRNAPHILFGSPCIDNPPTTIYLLTPDIPHSHNAVLVIGGAVESFSREEEPPYAAVLP
jgi:hypothetical protein